MRRTETPTRGPETRRFLGLFGALLAILLAAPVSAERVYWELGPLLTDMFPTAEHVTYFEIDLTSTEIDALEAQLGYRPARTQWTVFVALEADEIVGYAVFDEELGQHEPITFAVQLDSAGVVRRVEVVVYREAYGDEVTDARFRAQFVGMTAQDAMAVDHDIAAISGATISSRSLSTGTRRVASVVALLLQERQILAQLDL